MEEKSLIRKIGESLLVGAGAGVLTYLLKEGADMVINHFSEPEKIIIGGQDYTAVGEYMAERSRDYFNLFLALGVMAGSATSHYLINFVKFKKQEE